MMTVAVNDAIDPEFVDAEPDLSQADLPELAALANQHHTETVQRSVRTLESAWHAGRALNAAKDLCRHGEWLPWLAANFKATRTTATCYMQIANDANSHHLASAQSIDDMLKAIRAANKGNGKPPPPKPEPQPEPEDAVVIEDLMTDLWDASAGLDNEAKASLVADLHNLTEGLENVKKDRKAEKAAAMVTLRDAKTGYVPMNVICDLIVGETAPATPQMASWLADAIASKFGSWTAFDKARKEYGTRAAKEQAAVNKQLGIK